MNRRLLCLWTIAASLTLLAFSFPLAAMAAGCGCTPTPPPNCCRQPTPPTPPVNSCNCGSGGNNIIVPGVNVYVAPSVIVNASASANVNVSAAANGSGNGVGNGSGFGSGTAQVINSGGGGGGGWSEGGGSQGVIQGLNVEGAGGALQRTAYQASRTKVRIVVIQAVCLDDKDVPHPASQVTPDRELADTYSGEVYRCIAGARMQWTMADYNGKVDFSQGQTFTCNKSDALVLTHVEGQAQGKLQCMPQKPARDCNERSLLRRFGAGVKIIKIVTVETYTAYREEETRTASTSSSFSMSIDGGVGR